MTTFVVAGVLYAAFSTSTIGGVFAALLFAVLLAVLLMEASGVE